MPVYTQKYSKEQNFGLKIMDILQQKVFSREENEIIKNNLGLYSLSPENQYHEVLQKLLLKLFATVYLHKTHYL